MLSERTTKRRKGPEYSAMLCREYRCPEGRTDPCPGRICHRLRIQFPWTQAVCFLVNCTLTIFEISRSHTFKLSHELYSVTDEVDHRIALDGARGRGFRAPPARVPGRKDRIIRDSAIAPDCISLSAPWSLGVSWTQTPPNETHEHRGTGGPHLASHPLNR